VRFDLSLGGIRCCDMFSRTRISAGQMGVVGPTAAETDRQLPRLHSAAPVPRTDTEPPPAFLLRTGRTAEQRTTKTSRSWSPTRPVWIALGITAILAVAAVSDYRLNNPEQKQVFAAVATPAAAPVPEAAPARSAMEPTTGGLPPPDDRPPPAEAPAPPVAAALPVAASDPPPTVMSGKPPTTEQVTPAAPAAETSPISTEKPVASLPSSDVFVVRFDSKLPVLRPSGIRALTAAVRSAHAGRKVQIAIEGCDSGDSAPNGVDCADRVRRLKGFLVDMGVHHPAALIASSTRP
jgi:hypothetical protein